MSATFQEKTRSTWPGRMGLKRLGKGRCGVAPTTPSLRSSPRCCSSPPAGGFVDAVCSAICSRGCLRAVRPSRSIEEATHILLEDFGTGVSLEDSPALHVVIVAVGLVRIILLPASTMFFVKVHLDFQKSGSSDGVDEPDRSHSRASRSRQEPRRATRSHPAPPGGASQRSQPDCEVYDDCGDSEDYEDYDSTTTTF